MLLCTLQSGLDNYKKAKLSSYSSSSVEEKSAFKTLEKIKT